MKKFEIALEKLNGKRWTKSEDLDRVYIDNETACDIYHDMDNDKKSFARIPMNRLERQHGKIWIDCNTDEICVKNLDNDVKIAIEELIANI